VISVCGWLFSGAVLGSTVMAEGAEKTGTVAEVRPHNGVPTLFINHEPTAHVALAPIGDFPTDPDATHLGTLTPTDHAGLVVREFGDWRSVYFAAPAMTTDLFRGLVRYAGGHVYSTTDDVFDANSRYLMLHTSSAGPKEIHLPNPCNVRDVISNKSVGDGITTIRFDARRPGETHLFELNAEVETP